MKKTILDLSVFEENEVSFERRVSDEYTMIITRHYITPPNCDVPTHISFSIFVHKRQSFKVSTFYHWTEGITLDFDVFESILVTTPGYQITNLNYREYDNYTILHVDVVVE